MKFIIARSFYSTLALVFVLGITGCNRKPKDITYIGAGKGKGVADTGIVPMGPLDGQTAFPIDSPISPGVETLTTDASGNHPMGDLEYWENFVMNRDFFAANTVYFDFDQAAVKPSERVKVEEVAVYLQGDLKNAVLVEGHCDERGTEEYNRALGERRALSVREYLVNLGIQPGRIHTISYGEDKPAVMGQDDNAYSRNRRGEFILLTPKP